MSIYLAVAQLHPAITAFLKSQVAYGRKDISVSAAPQTSIAVGGGDGYRGFAILANLETGECRILWGSWGGANLFNPTNRVDLDTNSYPVPVNGAVISGQIGGGRPTYASMVVHPDNLPKLLPAPAASLDAHDQSILNAIGGLKSAYRKEALARVPDAETRITRLVQAGLLSRNKAGSLSITTAGKSARVGW